MLSSALPVIHIYCTTTKIYYIYAIDILRIPYNDLIIIQPWICIHIVLPIVMVSSNFWKKKHVIIIHIKFMALPDNSWSSRYSMAFKVLNLENHSHFSVHLNMCLSLSTYTYTAQCLEFLTLLKIRSLHLQFCSLTTADVAIFSHFCSHAVFSCYSPGLAPANSNAVTMAYPHQKQLPLAWGSFPLCPALFLLTFSLYCWT